MPRPTSAVTASTPTGETVENVEAQLDVHRTLQQQRKKILAEISLTNMDLDAARSEFESAEARLSSVRAREMELLQQLQSITLEMWRLEWTLDRSVPAQDRSSSDDGRLAPSASRYDRDIVLYDYQGDIPPGTVGTFFALEGKEVGKDVMFAPRPDGQYMVVDREIGEENRHRVLRLHLARIR
jgi:hypothetical protein